MGVEIKPINRGAIVELSSSRPLPQLAHLAYRGNNGLIKLTDLLRSNEIPIDQDPPAGVGIQLRGREDASDSAALRRWLRWKGLEGGERPVGPDKWKM
jgi:hypothetical protein